MTDTNEATYVSMTWDYDGWKKIKFSINYEQKDWNHELMTKINQSSAQIYKKTACEEKPGGADKITISANLVPFFNDLEYFHHIHEADRVNKNQIGTLCGRYKVIVDKTQEKSIVNVEKTNENYFARIKVLNYS